jgi:hypothetical protein
LEVCKSASNQHRYAAKQLTDRFAEIIFGVEAVLRIANF